MNHSHSKGTSRCLDCGAALRSSIGSPTWKTGGLTLRLNGIQVWTCENGHEEFEVPRLDMFREGIRQVLLSLNPDQLSGGELRFLRSSRGLSTEDLAQRLNVPPERVRAWENQDPSATVDETRKVMDYIRSCETTTKYPRSDTVKERPLTFRRERHSTFSLDSTLALA